MNTDAAPFSDRTTRRTRPASRRGFATRRGRWVLAVALSAAAGTVSVASAATATEGATTPAGHWSAALRVFNDKSGAALSAVSCAAAAQCTAVGTEGSSVSTVGVAVTGGTRWSSPRVVDSDGGFADVSCAPHGACVTVGGGSGDNGATYTLSGAKWSTGPTVPVALTALSCPTSTFCVGIAFLNYASAFMYNGTRWSAQIPIGAQGASLSCPTTTFCAVVSASGDVLYFENRAWTKPIAIDPNRGFSSISCVSSQFCVAVDDSGNALTDVGGTWSRPNYASPLDRSDSLTGVSCASRSFCVAVDSGGRAFYFTGSRWSGPQTIAAPEYLTSVSCPSTVACVAVGQNSFTSSTTTFVTTYSSPG